MPWKNGLGITTELFRYPASGEFVLRLSCAEVKDDGPFSLYEGYDRHLIILAGEGCVLKQNTRQIILKCMEPPYHFAGEESIFCQLLQGPIRDFNVMIDRNWGEAEIQILKPQGEIELFCDTDKLFIFNLDDESLLELENQDSITLYANALIIIEIKKGRINRP